MDVFEGLDWGTYYFFRFQANGAPNLRTAMQVGDWLGSYLACAILLAAAVAVSPRPVRWRTAVVVVTAYLISGLLNEAIKVTVERPRPPDAQNTLGTMKMSPSFPSRTVFLAAFSWVVLANAVERRTARTSYRIAIYTVAGLAIVFACVSELWLGLNWVTDVIAALAGGLGMALMGRWAATPTKKNGGGD